MRIEIDEMILSTNQTQSTLLSSIQRISQISQDEYNQKIQDKKQKLRNCPHPPAIINKTKHEENQEMKNNDDSERNNQEEEMRDDFIVPPLPPPLPTTTQQEK